jgi:3-isopropylmalate dehydratase small subunit
VAGSFGAIYERNAINAAFPIVSCSFPDKSDFRDGDEFMIDLKSGIIENLRNHEKYHGEPFSDVQFEVYQRGGLLG